MPNLPTLLRSRLAPLWIAALLACGGVQAGPLVYGAQLPALTLEDAHGKPVAIGPDVRRVLFAASMAGSDLVTGVLATEPAGVLTRLQGIYVADISRMPALISRLVALPRMRELPFAVALLRDAAAAATLAGVPREAGAVTVIHLEADRLVRDIQIVRDAAALRAALGLAPVSQEAGERASPTRNDDENRGH
jgi:hypothetical protein